MNHQSGSVSLQNLPRVISSHNTIPYDHLNRGRHSSISLYIDIQHYKDAEPCPFPGQIEESASKVFILTWYPMPDLYSTMMTAENEFKTSTTSQRLRFLCCPTVTVSSCNLPHITVLASVSPALIRIRANLIKLENSSTANALLQTKILDLPRSRFCQFRYAFSARGCGYK